LGLKRTGELRQRCGRIALTRGPSSPHLMKRPSGPLATAAAMAREDGWRQIPEKWRPTVSENSQTRCPNLLLSTAKQDFLRFVLNAERTRPLLGLIIVVQDPPSSSTPERLTGLPKSNLKPVMNDCDCSWKMPIYLDAQAPRGRAMVKSVTSAEVGRRIASPIADTRAGLRNVDKSNANGLRRCNPCQEERRASSTRSATHVPICSLACGRCGCAD